MEFVGNLQTMFEYLSGQAVWWGLVILAFAAVVEYVFPPFPGDMITVAGAILVPKAGWPLWGVFGAVLLGTVIGATIDWRVGVWLADRDDEESWLYRWLHGELVGPKIEKLERQFEKWGPIYISLNRFVPAFRALFFVAAGYARLELRSVLLYGCIGAALYNAVLLGIGYFVGYRLEAIASLLETYSRFFLVALIALIAAWLLKRGYDLFVRD